MRKIFIFILFLIMLTAMLFSTASASDGLKLSASHFEEFCTKWNDYFSRTDSRLNGQYSLSDDGNYVDRYFIIFNKDHLSMNYSSDAIPSTSTVYFSFDTDSGELTMIVTNKTLGELEKVVIIGEDNTRKELVLDALHDDFEAWAIRTWLTEMIDYYYLDHFQAVMTISGKEYAFEINRETHAYLYDMFEWIANGLLYCLYDADSFGNGKYLPPEPENGTTAHESGYSFRDDPDGMNQAANSVFYVEVYDDNLTLLGTASGFVAFDEHLFITNQHVIDGAAFLRITDDSKEGNRYILDQVIASDRDRDIAILLFPDGDEYAPLTLNMKEDFQRGQPVVAVGSPEGLKNTLSKGDISAIREEDGLTLIQTSVSLSYGSSGGALFDNNGNVIGVTIGGFGEGQNLNFAISVKAVQDLYDHWDKVSFEYLGTEKSWNISGN